MAYEKGFSYAAVELAKIYCSDIEIIHNQKKALEWALIAAGKGLDEGRYWLDWILNNYI